jgi:hypothetical protein
VRESIRDFVSIVARTARIVEPIYEFGSLQVPGQEGFADLRPLFPGKQYVGCDYRSGIGVDRVANLHGLDLPDGCAGTILCLDTLEHVEFPHRAVAEMSRVLNSQGLLAITSVMNFPIHDYPHDYWRFTPEAFRSLLSAFPHRIVAWAGKPDFPHTVVGIGSHDALFKAKALTDALEEWRDRWSREVPASIPQPSRSRWRNHIRPWLPPALLALYRRLRGRRGLRTLG